MGRKREESGTQLREERMKPYHIYFEGNAGLLACIVATQQPSGPVFALGIAILYEKDLAPGAVAGQPYQFDHRARNPRHGQQDPRGRFAEQGVGRRHIGRNGGRSAIPSVMLRHTFDLASRDKELGGVARVLGCGRFSDRFTDKLGVGPRGGGIGECVGKMEFHWSSCECGLLYLRQYMDPTYWRGAIGRAVHQLLEEAGGLPL